MNPSEELIGEFRAFARYKVNWDSEGASAPNLPTLTNAISACGIIDDLDPQLLDDFQSMLHVTGNAGLFYEEHGQYVDIEFLPTGRVAYFASNGTDQDRGTLPDPLTLPTLIATWLKRNSTNG